MRNIPSSTRMRVARAVPLVAAGLVGLALAGPASADSWRRHDGDTVIVNHYGSRDHWRPEHRRAVGHRPRVVREYYYYDAPPPVVVREYHYEAPPPVVVHQRVYREPAYRQQTYVGPPRESGAFTAQSLIGAAIGGLLGSQIGGGDGNRAATAAGAVTGLLIGSRVR